MEEADAQEGGGSYCGGLKKRLPDPCSTTPTLGIHVDSHPTIIVRCFHNAPHGPMGKNTKTRGR